MVASAEGAGEENLYLFRQVSHDDRKKASQKYSDFLHIYDSFALLGYDY